MSSERRRRSEREASTTSPALARFLSLVLFSTYRIEIAGPR